MTHTHPPLTEAELLELVGADAPRPITPAIRARLGLDASGRLAMFASVFLGIGLLLCLVGIRRNPLDSFWLGWSKTATAPATVVEVEPTVFTVGSREPGSGIRVQRFVFSFVTQDGTRHEDASFSATSRLQAGASAQAVYVADTPSIACLRGMSSQPFGIGSMLLLLLPTTGILIVLLPWLAYRGRVRLVREGRYVDAEIVSMHRSPFGSSEHPQFRLQVRFSFDGRTLRASKSCQGAEARAALQRQEDGEPVGLFVDPKRPRRFVLAERLSSLR